MKYPIRIELTVTREQAKRWRKAAKLADQSLAGWIRRFVERNLSTEQWWNEAQRRKSSR